MHARFRFDKHRHTYLVSHALLRGALSQIVDITPDQWEFRVNAFGKPCIANPSPSYDIRFNLSHTTGMAVLAVAMNRELGVDVEHLGRLETNTDIAERFFAPEEVAELLAQPQDTQSMRFMQYWTLKESYIKAIGMGLSCPLDSFAFLPGTPVDAPALLRVDDPTLSQTKWQFWQEKLGEQHLLALCLQADTKSPLIPRLEKATWLY